jgi:hypothetical protein
VGAVDGIACLKGAHAVPFLFGKQRACLVRVAFVCFECPHLGALDHPHFTAEIHVAGRFEILHAGVLVVVGTECRARLARLVGRVHIFDQNDAHDAAVAAQRSGEGRAQSAQRRFRCGQGDGQRPRQSGRKAHAIEHGFVLIAAHETFQWAHRTDRDQQEIGCLARIEVENGQGRRVFCQRVAFIGGHDARDESPAVRRYH